MTKQNKEWLSIAESVVFTGRSDSTIRRAIKGMTKSLSKQFVKKEGNKVFIAKAFLKQKFSIEEKKQPTTEGQKKNVVGDSNGLVDHLREQVAIKDKQIDRLQTTVESLTERNRENNILIGHLQKLLEISVGFSPSLIQNVLNERRQFDRRIL